MRKLFVIGIALVVFVNTCIAAEPIYDAGKLNKLADQIESEAKMDIDKAGYPAEVSLIVWKSQLNFSRLLMRQHDEIIRQNNEMIRLNNKMVRQNDEIIRQNSEIIQLLRQLPKK